MPIAKQPLRYSCTTNPRREDKRKAFQENSSYSHPLFLPFSFVDVDAADLPVCFFEFLGIAFDPFVARLVLLELLRTVEEIPIAGDAAAEGEVDDEAHIAKVPGWAACLVAYWEVSIGESPFVRVGSNPLLSLLACGPYSIHQIGRDSPMRREHPRPHVTVDGVPLQGVYAAALVVQGLPQRIPLQVDGHAPLVEPLVRVVHIAVLGVTKGHVRDARLFVGNPHGRVPGTRLYTIRDVVHRASLGGVQSGLGHRLVGHALDNVYLSIHRPIRLVRCSIKSE
mmetsp:Transcript_57300/g.170855  ORF Transcript_57300/g.170855 Transcript_57300/m.170855 type:complete len:281 (-) Transcript_57300:120-962(-)